MALFFALFSENRTRKGATMNDETLRVYLKTNCYGKSRLIAGSALEQQLHINGSDLRKRINRLRRKGVPIASSREGYFYAATAGEVYATIRLLREMTAGLESAIRGLEAALESFGEGGENHR